MDKQLQRLRKGEHRQVCFLLREGLGYLKGSKVWKHMTTRSGPDLFTFGQVRTVVPGFDLNLSYLQLAAENRPTLKSLICCKKSDQLIQLLPEFQSGLQQGHAFNHGRIKAGLIVHNFELPSDRYSASMIWDLEHCQVRLQQFAEFCLAMRSIDWKPQCEGWECNRIQNVLANLALDNLKPIALRIFLLVMACFRDPQVIRNLQARGFGVTSQIEEGVSYLVLPHSDVSRLFDCDKSSAKRSFNELAQRGFIQAKTFGRHIGYRCNLNINWGGAK